MASAILFSDLHCSNKYLAVLPELVFSNSIIKALIFAGDVVNTGEPVWFAEKFVDIIAKIGLPLFWVPGNNDFGRSYHKINAKYKSLEGRIVSFEGRAFTGVGGSPASWSGQYAGEDMVDRKKIGGSIFVSHVPPPGILTLQQKDLPSPTSTFNSSDWQEAEKSSNKRSLDFARDDNRKSKNDKINDQCEMKNDQLPRRRFGDAPLVHICGHLHYRWGTSFLGQTKVIQLSSFNTGHYAIMDLETLAVEFKRLK